MPGALRPLDDAAGHAVAGAGLFAVGIGLGVNDDGGPIGVEQRVIGAGVKGDSVGEDIGTGGAVGPPRRCLASRRGGGCR